VRCDNDIGIMPLFTPLFPLLFVLFLPSPVPSFTLLGLSLASLPLFTPASTPALPLCTPHSHLVPTIVPPHSHPCSGAMVSATWRRCGGGDVAMITPLLTSLHPFICALAPTLLHPPCPCTHLLFMPSFTVLQLLSFMPLHLHSHLIPALTCALFVLLFAHSFGCPGPCSFILVWAYVDLCTLICAHLHLWLTTLAGTVS
jgi:hypothetical protein